jgi:hypothetical protein
VVIQVDTASLIESGFINPPDSIAPELTNDTIAVSDTLNTNTTSKIGNQFSNENLTMYFSKDSIVHKESMIISNILTLINTSGEKITFYNKLSYPAAWKSISFFDEKVYSMLPNDTVKIPITLIPSKGLIGGTSIYINATIIDSTYNQIGDHNFGIHTTKTVSWSTTVSPDRKMFFKNHEKTKNITYTLTNDGTNAQDFFVSFKTFKKDIVLTDTLGNEVLPDRTFVLDPKADTSFNFNITALRVGDRNFKRVSTNNYIPQSNLNKTNYSLFIESSEPNTVGSNLKKGDKINLVRLPNQVSVSDVSSSTLPLIVETNVNNLFGDNTFMSVNLRGYKQINNEASLSYFSQLNYNTVYWNPRLVLNSPWYIGYFDDRITAEAGQVNGNIMGISGYGRGIKGSYRYANDHKTGAFYVRSPRLFGPANSQSFGLTHDYDINENIRLKAGFGRTVLSANNLSINAINLISKFRIANKHYFVTTFSGTNTDRTLSGVDYRKYGFLAGLNYNSVFLEKKLKVSFGGRFNNKSYSPATYERLNLNLMSSYRINDAWLVSMSNFYNNTRSFDFITDTVTIRQELLNNTVIFNTQNRYGSFQPGLFYNYQNLRTGAFHSRGLSFRFSKFDFSKNFMMSAQIRGAYNDAVNYEAVRNYFTFQFSSLLRYKVWSFNAQYFYGANSPILVEYMLIRNMTPQSLRLSLQNQYQFANKHFVFENSLVYNYANTLNNHSFSLFPQLFYFNNTGWRFSINMNYTFNSNNYGSIYNTINNPTFPNEVDPNMTGNFMVGFTVRKEFKIPIPFVKTNAMDVRFVAFYDINGNSIRDNNEPTIPDVVITIDKRNEVLTDLEGYAYAKNVTRGLHKLDLNALEITDGWFINLPDSCDIMTEGDFFIPYTRGVKVYGDVTVDRQDIALMDKDKVMDLSNIKITASNGQVYHTLTDGNGKFEFYVPNGNYVITLDEKILGSKFVVSKNNIPVNLQSNKSNIYVSFYISERKRNVNIKSFGDDW